MSSDELISQLTDKGLLDDETVENLNKDLEIELERKIAYYKNLSFRKGLSLTG